MFDNINPIKLVEVFLIEAGKTLVLSSYWICLIAGMVGLILYIFGYKKGKNYPMISLALYLIINIIGSVIF